MNKILDEKMLLAIGAIIFIALFVFFYPNFYHYPDEQVYLRNAFLIFSGTMKISNPLYSYGYIFNGTDYVSIYPPLQSIIIAPFALANWKLAFLSGLFLHLLNFFIFYKILKKLKINPVYSLLFLFFPEFALASTTLQAELSSMTSILLAAYFFIGNNRKETFLSGFFAGLSVLARYTNIAVATAFFIATIIDKEKRKNALVFLIATVPSGIALLAFNAFLYGSPFSTAYQIAGYTQLSFSDFVPRILYYILLLSIIYPLMFFAMFFSKTKLKSPAIISSTFFLIIWGAYFFFYPRFRLEDVIVGADKFMPIIPLMIICYAEIFDRVVKKTFLERHLSKILAIVFITLVVCSFVVMAEHKKKQDAKFEIFSKIYSETTEGALIIIKENMPFENHNYKENPFTGMFFAEPFGDRKIAKFEQDYSKYITDENNTFFMEIWIDPVLKVEIIHYKNLAAKSEP